MRADLALEKSITNKGFYLVINKDFYIEITEQQFNNLAAFIGIDIKE